MTSSNSLHPDPIPGPLPEGKDMKEAFETALSSLDSVPYKILEWAEAILQVLQTMRETLQNIQGLTAQATQQTNEFDTILGQWVGVTLDPALAILERVKPSSADDTFSSRTEKLKETFLGFMKQLYAAEEGTAPVSLQPLTPFFLSILLTNSTTDSTNLVNHYSTFLHSLSASTLGDIVRDYILPKCFVICCCSSQQQVIGISSESWIVFKGIKKQMRTPAFKQLKRMIKDIRFHWVAKAHYKQRSSTAGASQAINVTDSYKHIQLIRNMGSCIRSLIVEDGMSMSEAKKEMFSEFPEATTFPPLLSHRATILDGKSGQPKPRCAKCRILFERSFSQDQQDSEQNSQAPMVFAGFACAEDVGVALCRAQHGFMGSGYSDSRVPIP